MQCGGVWIYLQQLPAVSEAGLAEPSAVGGQEAEDQDVKAGLCPEGHGILIRARVEVDQPFYLDRCFKCGGVWFDSGEWQRLATHHLISALPEIWTQEWQDRQRAEKEHESYIDWARSVFGDDLASKLCEVATALANHPRLDEALAFVRNESLRREQPE
jgi:Zn-finger nucleic acid-binding protein